MTHEIINVKTKIITNHRDTFKNHPGFDLEEVVDTFLRVVEYRNLTGILDGLRVFYLEDQFSALETARKNFAANIEGYLKTVFKISDGQEVTEMLAGCFNKFFDTHCNLADNERKVFFSSKKDGYKSNSAAYFKGKLPFGAELKTIYDLRNAIGSGHDKAIIEYFDADPKVVAHKRHWVADIEDCIIVYLFITYKYLPKLRRFFEPNMTRYLESVIQEFEEERLRFVHIKGKFEDIIHAKATFEHQMTADLREGTVATLREKIKVRKMLVTGDAGMGKTTTVRYLAACDAEHLLRDYDTLSIQCPLPVYVELKNFKDDESNSGKVVVSVRDLILKKIKLGLDISVKTEEEKVERYADNLLTQGKITLFLDGLNEIPKEAKESKHQAIVRFLKDFDRVFYILTSRKEDYKGVVSIDIPVFELQKMDSQQIASFLEKNTDNERVRSLIQDAVKKNDSLRQFVGVPLVLLTLIKVVEVKGEIPVTQTLIIGEFIAGLYDWQCRKPNSHFTQAMSKKLDSLLCHLAICIKKLYDTNTYLAYGKIIEYFQERNQAHGLQVDPAEALQTAKDLNILVEKERKYAFVHQLFLEYYAAEELTDLEF